MSINTEQKWNEALTLSEAGRFREANVLLRQILPEAADPTLRLTCARLIAREMLIDAKNDGRFPDPGTQKRDELCKYLQIAIESYMKAGGPARSDAQEDVARFKAVLQSLTTGNVTMGSGQNTQVLGNSREQSVARVAQAMKTLADQNEGSFLFLSSANEVGKVLFMNIESQRDFDNADGQIIDTIEKALTAGRQVAISAAGARRLIVMVSKLGKRLFR